MDETRIDTLTIEIGASSDKATREVDKLSSRLKNLKDKSVRVNVDSKSVGTANKRISLLSKTLSSLKRIAFYRLIRTALKEIGEAFREGQENAYWYSKTVGEETKYISEAYDNLASSSFKMKNQLGAAWATLRTAITPVLLEIVSLITTAANAITQFFAVLSGKSTYLKAIDYAKDWAEATDSGSKSAKEWKNQLLGFDVINRLEEPSSSGGGVSALTDYENMFEEAKISDNIAKIGQKLKPFFDFILDNVGKIAVGFAAWKISESLLSKLGNLGSTLGKIATGAVLITIGAKLSYDAGYDLAKDSSNFASWVEGIVGTLAAGIGGAIIGHTVAGPAGPAGVALGFVIGVGVGVAFMISGFRQGELDKVVESAFFNGEGSVTITELANAFKLLAENVVKVNQPIIDAGNNIIDIRNNKVQPAIDKINEIGIAISRGVTTAEEQIPNLVAAFEELKSGTKEILDEVYNNVVRAVSGSLYDALSDAGVYVPELLSVLEGVKGDVDSTFASLQASYKGLADEYARGKISADDYYGSLVELSNKMSDLIGYSDPVSSAFSTISGELKGINWESEEAKNNAFTIIKNAASEASTSVDEAYKTINDNINTMRGWSKDPVFQDTLSEIFLANEATREAQRKQIGNNLQLLFDQIQTDLVDKTQNVIDVASEEWSNMSGWKRFWSGAGSEAGFVKDSLKNYEEKIMNPILKDIQEAFDSLGVDGSTWAEDAMTGILDNMFSYKVSGGARRGTKITTFSEDVGKDVEKAFAPLAGQFEGYGVSYIEGIKTGMDENRNLVSNASKDVTDGMKSVIENELDIHSPSGVAKDYGKNFIEGLANGLTENTDTVMSALSTLLSGMLIKFQGFIDSVINGYNSMLDSIKESMNSISASEGFPKNNAKNVTVNTAVPYASGGFPEDGFFFANRGELVGRFSNGRTAVANNEQITEGISRAVYEAFTDALSQTGSDSERSDEKEIVIQIDGQTAARALYRPMQNEAKRHGTRLVSGGVFA